MSILDHGIRVGQRRKQDTELGPLECLPERTRRALIQAGDRYTVWPGQTVLAEGSTVRWVFVVLDGELAVRRAGFDWRVISPGSIYGALETVNHESSAGDLVARDVSQVLALPAQAFKALAETDPHFSYWLIRALAGEKREHLPFP